jgi:hypothetical protein
VLFIFNSSIESLFFNIGLYSNVGDDTFNLESIFLFLSSEFTLNSSLFIFGSFYSGLKLGLNSVIFFGDNILAELGEKVEDGLNSTTLGFKLESTGVLILPCSKL